MMTVQLACYGPLGMIVTRNGTTLRHVSAARGPRAREWKRKFLLAAGVRNGREVDFPGILTQKATSRGAPGEEDKNLRAFLCEESCADPATTVGFPKLGMLAPIISRKVGL